MKKSLLRILIILLFATNANAQVPPAPWFQITNGNFTGAVSTAAYGATTATTAGIPSCAFGLALPACAVPPPAATQYEITGGGGMWSFSFTGQKVYGVRIVYQGLNNTEIISMVVNTAAYDITLANFPPAASSFTGNCPCAPIGPCFLAPNPLTGKGEIHGPTGGVGTAACNGGDFTISECTGIASFLIQCNGLSGGISFAVYVDTIRPKSCSNATNNSPCEGDTLKLFDSTTIPGATYYWYGPYGFTSTLRNPFKFPALLTDSGLYHCVISGGLGVLNDTDTTYVAIHPRPYITTLTTNTPLCANPLDTLHLIMTGIIVPGETWSWTGPGGLFTSALQDPDIYGFTVSDTGWYTLVTNTPYGCKVTDSVFASLQLPPPPPVITAQTPLCYASHGTAYNPFTVVTVAGSSVFWYTTTTGGVGSPAPTLINTLVAGTTKVYVSAKMGMCESARDSATVVVMPRIDSNFTWKTLLGCDSNIVTFTNNTANFVSASWLFGDQSGSADTFITQHAYKFPGVYRVIMTASNGPCSAADTGYVNTKHSITPSFYLTPNPICAVGLTIKDDSSTKIVDNTIITQPDGYLAGLTGNSKTIDTGMNVTDTTIPKYLAANYQWYWGDGAIDNTNTRKPAVHKYNTGGKFPVVLYATDSIGCVDTAIRYIPVLQMTLTSFHDTLICISQPLPLAPLLSFKGPDYHLSDFPYSWSPGTFLSDSNSQKPYFSGLGLITYTITATNNQLGCQATDTMRIHSVRGVILSNVTKDATIYYGNSIQLNADSEVLYVWRPDDGSLNNPNLNNPVAHPLVTTQYTVYGYDINGCIDSTYVTIHVDSTMNEDMPSGFTPNGDGLNDVFRPVGIKFQSTVDFRVYNRLGQQVFYSNNYKQGWDGTFNGQPQDIGTYFYVITVARPGGDGENVIYKGTVTLIR